MQDPLSGWRSTKIVAVVQSKSNEGLVKQVVLPEKYSDFFYVFNKAKTNELLEHLHHDLAIELINNK